MKWYEEKQTTGMRVSLVVNRTICLQYLKDTDWYITRLTETNVPTPTDVTAKRTEARLALNL